jgi:peptidoglycan hydrolase-like protein with peptidoglycan-binding domain
MLKRKARTLAITGITIASAAVVTLTTTGAASAATMTASASGHVAAPMASAATACVGQTFSIADENTYETCVRYEQILLNDLWGVHAAGNQELTVDGYYGPDTTSDVTAFQAQFSLIIDGITGDQTWGALCHEDQVEGFTGVYWHDAGCYLL